MDFEKLRKEATEQKINQNMIAGKKVAKWEKYGLLEGLKGKAEKARMARLLENEAKWLLTEASETADINGFQAIAFPLVRRTFGHLLTQEIASVQPMSLPSGLVFWLDFTFGTGNKAGTGKDDWTAGGSVYGDPLAPLTGGADAEGGHYFLHNSYTQYEASASVGIASSGSATWSEVDFDPDLSGAVRDGNLFKVTVDYNENANITNVDTTNYQSFAISGAVNADVTKYYRRHNELNGTVLTVFYSGSQALDSGSSVQFAYVKKSTHTANSDGSLVNPAFEYAFDNSDNIPEIDIKIASHPVVANDRKLKVKWTPEVAQDLNAYHSVDAEAELTQIMSDHMALDVDAEVLRDMVNNAKAAKFFWDRRPGFFVDKETGEQRQGPSFTGNVQEWYLTLMETILDVSNVISRKTLRTGANFIVTSPDVCTILESMVQWRPVMDYNDTTQTKFSMGVEKAGSLANRFTVYKVPFFYRNVILVGYKGDEWLNTGYVYAPYVPMIVTPTIYEPDNFTPRKAVMTRYAKQVIRGDYYGLVVLKGMGIF